MEFTGERVIPGLVEIDDLLQQHLARYHFASQVCAGRLALDAGCGTGYGTALLAAAGARVVAVDRAADAIAYARRTYGLGRAAYLVADCDALPFAPASFDLVVALEVIEHLASAGAFAREARRLLRPGGLFVVSTPNAAAGHPDDSANPFHVREFTRDELFECLRSVFPAIALMYQYAAQAQIIGPETGGVRHASPPNLPQHGLAQSTAAQLPAREPEFFVAVCALDDAHLPRLGAFWYEVPAASLPIPAYTRRLEQELDVRDQQIAELAEEQRRLTRVLEQREAHILALEDEQRRLTRAIEEKGQRLDLLEQTCWELDRQVQEKESHAQRLGDWARGLQEGIVQRDRHLADVSDHHLQLRSLIEAKDAHASGLEAWCASLQQTLREKRAYEIDLDQRRQALELALLCAEASLAWTVKDHQHGRRAARRSLKRHGGAIPPTSSNL